MKKLSFSILALLASSAMASPYNHLLNLRWDWGSSAHGVEEEINVDYDGVVTNECCGGKNWQSKTVAQLTAAQIKNIHDLIDEASQVHTKYHPYCLQAATELVAYTAYDGKIDILKTESHFNGVKKCIEAQNNSPAAPALIKILDDLFALPTDQNT